MNALTPTEFLDMPEPRLPAPASWLVVDAPRVAMLINVEVELPDGRTSYQRAFYSTLDAYDDALTRYPRCISIKAEPVKGAAA